MLTLYQKKFSCGGMIVDRDLTLSFQRAADIKPDSRDPRRKLERQDFSLISEDHSAPANLPKKAQHHEFPKEGGYFPFAHLTIFDVE